MKPYSGGKNEYIPTYFPLSADVENSIAYFKLRGPGWGWVRWAKKLVTLRWISQKSSLLSSMSFFWAMFSLTQKKALDDEVVK